MNTFTFTPRPTDRHYTVAELNALFAAIAAALGGKVDVRGDTLTSDLRIVGSVINVPIATQAGDIVGIT